MPRIRVHGRIEIVLAGEAYQREQAIAASVGESCAHQLGLRKIGDTAHGPARRNPFSRPMRKRGGQDDEAAILIHVGRLQDRDLMLTEGLAHDVEPG